jgi:hypothetical protein
VLNEAGLFTLDHVLGDLFICLPLFFRRSWLRPNAIGAAQGAHLNFRVQLRSRFAEILVTDPSGRKTFGGAELLLNLRTAAAGRFAATGSSPLFMVSVVPGSNQSCRNARRRAGNTLLPPHCDSEPPQGNGERAFALLMMHCTKWRNDPPEGALLPRRMLRYERRTRRSHRNRRRA